MSKDRRLKRKLKLVAYKGGCCKMCGYSKCISALTFHHRIPRYKRFKIADRYTSKWSVLKHEVDKCDLLCKNCHAEVHSTEDKFLNGL